MNLPRIFSIILVFFFVSAFIPSVPAEDLQLSEDQTGSEDPSLEDVVTKNLGGIGRIFGVFTKPKWTYNGDDWKKQGDRWKAGGDTESALHAYDKALENYGLALKNKEVEWQTKDARYNKWGLAPSQSDMREDDTFMTGKTEMTPFVKENIRHVLASKEVIYKKKGDNEKALDCLNSLLVDDPTGYNLLKEKADVSRKLGRTAEAAEVQKLADANKPQPTPRYASPNLLVLIGAIASIFLFLKRKRD